MMLRRRLFALAFEARWQLAGVTALGFAILAAGAVQGAASARALFLILDGAAFDAVGPILLLLAAAIVLRSLLQIAAETASMLAAGTVKRRMRRRLYAHLLELGPGYLAQTRSGLLQSVLVDAVEALEGYLGYYAPQLVVTLVGPPFLIAAIVAVDRPVGCLVAFCFVAALAAPPLWERGLADYGRRHWRAYGELAAMFHDSLQGMTTLKAYGAAGRRGLALHQKALELYRETMAQLSLSLARSGLIGLARAFGTSFAAGYGALRVSRGELDLPGLLLIVFLTGVAFAPLDDLDRHWHRGFGGVTAEPLLYELLGERPEVEEKKGLPELRIGPRPELEFDNVTFAYRHRGPALRGLSFRIAAGERVALVGPSGAGKSTAAALALRFFDPQEGRIRLAGRDLRDYRLEDLRRASAWVGQDTFLFPASVAENLALGRPGASPEEIEAAARAARLHDFALRQPRGYATAVGERGAALSGGERQRLAIARALLKDAPLLILDEATSAVDNATEGEIRDALAELSAGRTTLVIAHRLAAVENADRVVVLEAGRVVEEGKPAELLMRGGAFARFAAAQRGEEKA